MKKKLLTPRYRLLKEIHKGEQSEVYLVEDLLYPEVPRVAKILTQKAAGKPETIPNEFKILTELDHPNLVDILETGITSENQYYYLAPYLEALPASPAENEEFLIQSVEQILKALAYLHQEGIFHGDLKPSNILRDKKSGWIQLIDFGLAALASSEKRHAGGTLPYTPPEVLEGKKTGPSSDLYSLGMTLYQWITGKLPFESPKPETMVQWHLSHEPLTLELETSSPVMEKIVEAVCKLTQTNPRERFLTVEELHRFLFAKEIEIGTPPPLFGEETFIKNIEAFGASPKPSRPLILYIQNEEKLKHTLRKISFKPEFSQLDFLTAACQPERGNLLSSLILSLISADPSLIETPIAADLTILLKRKRGKNQLALSSNRLWQLISALKEKLAGTPLVVTITGLENLNQEDLPLLNHLFLLSQINPLFLNLQGSPLAKNPLFQEWIQKKKTDQFEIIAEPLPDIKKHQQLLESKLSLLGKGARELIHYLDYLKEPFSPQLVESILPEEKKGLVFELDPLWTAGLIRRIKTSEGLLFDRVLPPAKVPWNKDIYYRIAAFYSALKGKQALAAAYFESAKNHSKAYHLFKKTAETLDSPFQKKQKIDLLNGALRNAEHSGETDDTLFYELASEEFEAGLFTSAWEHIQHIAKPTAATTILKIRCAVRLGKFEEAENILAAFRPTAKQIPQTLKIQANLFFKKGKLTEGLDLFKKHKTVVAADGSLLILQGLFHYYLKNLEEAESCFKKGTALCSKEKNLTDELKGRINLALVAFEKRNYRDALKDYDKAKTLADKIADPYSLQFVYQNTGAIYLEQGEYAKARLAFDASLTLARELGDSRRELAVMMNLANWHLKLADPKSAELFIQKIKKIPHQTPRLESYLALLQGDLAHFTGQMDRARQLYSGIIDSEPEYATANLLRLAIIENNQEEAQKWLPLLLDLKTALSPSTRLIMARAAILLGECHKPIIDELVRWTKTSPYKECPELLWEVQIALAHIANTSGNVMQAGHWARKARETLFDLKANVPLEFRKNFLEEPHRKQGLNEITALLSQTETHTVIGRYEALLRVNRQITTLMDLNSILEKIMDSAIDFTKANRGFILLGESPGKLRVTFSRNYDQEEIPPSQHQWSTKIARQSYQTGETIISTDASSDPRFEKFLSVHAFKLRSIITVPLVFEEKKLGVLYMDNPLQTGLFKDEDKSLLEQFAAQASIALNNAYQKEELENNQREIERLNRHLEQGLAQQTVKVGELSTQLKAAQKTAFDEFGYENIIGKSAAIKKVFFLLDRIVPTDSTACIYGETGTGKELIARAIHFQGARHEKPFITVNVTAIPATLFESELFGYKKGAFTGAVADTIGLFEAAHGGTLFLDEIGELPLPQQAKMLRAIQNREIRRVGDSKSISIDVRLVCATNKNLKDLVEKEKFREDLYYRLNVFQIDLPPLRKRKEDIPLLVDYFLKSYPEKKGIPSPTISTKAMRILTEYSWPGNIRELENELEKSAILAERKRIEPDHLSQHLLYSASAAVPAEKGPDTYEARMKQYEKEVLTDFIRRTEGNKAKAAELMGIPRVTLYRRLKALGMT